LKGLRLGGTDRIIVSLLQMKYNLQDVVDVQSGDARRRPAPRRSRQRRSELQRNELSVRFTEKLKCFEHVHVCLIDCAMEGWIYMPVHSDYCNHSQVHFHNAGY